MIIPNAKLSELLSLLAEIAPLSQGVGSATSGWVDASAMQRIRGRVSVGVFGASATVDAKFQQATSSGGAGAKDVTGTAITQLLAAGGNGRQVLINLDPQEALDVENGFRWVQLSITVGTAATLIGGAVEGAPRFDDASALNAASVAQIVN